MWQNRESHPGAQIIITAVSLNIYQFIIKQISSVTPPFCICFAVTAMGALDDGGIVFSCDF
jgi:hypothetical protein